MDSVQCFRVLSILPGSVGREKLVEGTKMFPDIPEEVFEEIKHKPLEVLIGNTDLSIQP